MPTKTLAKIGVRGSGLIFYADFLAVAHLALYDVNGDHH